VAWLLGLAFFAVPFVEIAVIIEVGSRIGWDTTVVLLILLSAGGAWLVKREGLDSWRRVQAGMGQGRMPTSDVVDAFLVLMTGVLLLCPGFITSAIGLVLIMPPVRSRAGDVVRRWIRRRVTQRVRTVGSRLGDSYAAGGTADGAADGRAYRRPDEPAGPSDGPKVWGARVRTPGDDDHDVIDVDGEEIVFGQGELGPPGF
jgi:UPF0716 protein FxsA